MKHFKMNKTNENDTYSNLDNYDYADFDDDYYYDLIEEKAEQRSKRKRPPRRSTRYADAFHNYVKDF